MIDEDLHHLLRTATRDITASASLRGRLTNRRPTRTPTQRWWMTGLAAAAAAAVLVLIPLLRPSAPAPTTATPPAVSTPSVVTESAPRPSGTAQAGPGAQRDAPTPADITACRTDAANSPPRTHQLLLCFFVPTGVVAPYAYTTEPPLSPGALVIGVVDPVAVSEVRDGLGVRNGALCLQRYPLWVVAGDVGRRSTSGCGDGDKWQDVIDDAADHIGWTVVDSAVLCAASTGISGSPIKAPIRMALLCRPGARASVLTGAAATALATAAQASSVGSPCTVTGWGLTTVAGLTFHHVSLPTVNDASGCRLAASVQAGIDSASSAGAVVHGRFQMAGGPAPGTPRPVPGTITVHRSAAPDGAIVAMATADSDGRFAIDVSAGSYIVTGTSPMVQNGQAVCRAPTPLVVADGQTITDVTVTCSVR